MGISWESTLWRYDHDMAIMYGVYTYLPMIMTEYCQQIETAPMPSSNVVAFSLVAVPHEIGSKQYPTNEISKNDVGKNRLFPK